MLELGWFVAAMSGLETTVAKMDSATIVVAIFGATGDSRHLDCLKGQ
jgi:hypothetical protein